MRMRGLVALASMSALALSACGGGSHRPTAAPGSPQNPLVGKPTQSSSGGRTNEGATQSSGQPGYQKLLEKQSSNPTSTFTPCNLVSQAQARAILGGPVMAPVEAPQGPTCIYRSKRGKGFVTLAVQNAPIAALKHQLHKRQAVGVSHRTGYCGVYGQPLLYVALPHHRVLSVGASCSVARRFAARAVAGLEG